MKILNRVIAKTLVVWLLCIPAIATGQKQGRLLTDSLLAEISTHNRDTSLVSLYDLLSYTYANINPDSGLLFAGEALSLANELNWERGKAAAYSDMGINHNVRSERYKALEYYEKALEIYRKLDAKTSEAAVLSNMALVYHKQSSYARALDYYMQALAVMEETGNKGGIAITLENIGTLYKEQGDYEKTEGYYKKAIALNREINDGAGLARNLGNMGIVYDARGKYTQALESHLSAYEANRKIGNRYGMQINLANVGIAYLHMGKLQQALEKQQQALLISEELGDKTSIAINAGNLGETYYSLAQETGSATHSELAIKHLDRSVALCMETNALAPAAEFIKFLSDAYLLSGNYRQAYKYQKMLTDVKDTVYTVKSKLEIANLESQREVALKEKDLQLKNKQIEIAQLEIKKRRAVQGFYVAGIMLLAVVLVVTVMNIVSYRKSNRLLADEKRLHLETILNQNMEIKARNEILEEMAHKHSHDIRGHVATILGLSQMFNRQEYADENNKVIVDGIADSAEALDEVIKEVV
ncbi:MAG TPA: tetratricopeptide repeat protein, partial [Flavipsychrobacter sp.]